MSKTKAKKSKNIALIDKDLILYLALIEQNDFHDTNYFWQNFKNVELLNHACKTKNFDLILFNDSSLEAEKIQSDHPIFANSSICPIIILSTNHESKFTSPKFDKITHFSIIHKPFRFMTLLKRMEEALEIQDTSNTQHLKIGPFLLKPFEKVLLGHNNEKLRLTDIEVKILKIFSKNRNEFVKKQILMEEVWGIKHFLDTHTLETHIYRLRKKLRIHFEKKLSIKSKQGAYAMDDKSEEIL